MVRLLTAALSLFLLHLVYTSVKVTLLELIKIKTFEIGTSDYSY